MNTFSKVSLLVTASSALFLPACGSGGGEGKDYYVSVQSFRTGSKGFYFASSPSAEVYADPGGMFGRYYTLSEGFKNLIGVGANSDVAYEDDPRVGDDAGVYTRGSFNCGTPNVVDLGYYTSGGASGQGYLYIAFQGANGPSDDVAHFMGAANPNDVKVAGLNGTADNFWLVQDSASQILLVTLNGATIKIVMNFSTGLADVRLVVAAADDALSLQAGGNMNEPHVENTRTGEVYSVGGSAGEQVLVRRQTAFFAVDR